MSTFCSQRFPQLWSGFVDHFVDFGFTGECCAPPGSQAGSAPAPGKISLPAAQRLVAIGDLHGDLDKARRAFQLGGLADERGNWVGGETVCVQVGDILDRGDGELKIFYYMEKLQQQAKAAGGQLHVLNGNHETMNTAGQHRYASPGSAVETLHWHFWQDIAAALKQRCSSCAAPPAAPQSSSAAPPPPTPTLASPEPAAPSTASPGSNPDGPPAAHAAPPAGPPEFEGLLLALQRLDLPAKQLRHLLRHHAFGPGQPAAQRFLAPHPTVLQVGGSVFVHGGILPHHVEYGLDRINRETAAWMQGQAPPGTYPSFLTGANAIVWARDYSENNEARCDCTKLQGVLASIPDAARMVVGHTIQQDGINAACDEQVLRVDVGMSKGCGDGEVEVLEIIGDQQVRRIQEGAPAKVVVPPRRAPPPMTPFWQQVIQAAAGAAKA